MSRRGDGRDDGGRVLTLAGREKKACCQVGMGYGIGKKGEQI